MDPLSYGSVIGSNRLRGTTMGADTLMADQLQMAVKSHQIDIQSYLK